MRLFALLLALLCTSSLSARTAYSTFGKITIALLDSASAAALSQQPDAYTAEHTPFDLAVRLSGSNFKEADYLAASAANVRDWLPQEATAIRAAFAEIYKKTQAERLFLHMPDTVKFIKTTAAEEFGAEGWTRANRIMLNTEAQPISTGLVAHELWHVISRYNASMRTNAYALFGFRPCNNVVYKPAPAQSGHHQSRLPFHRALHHRKKPGWDKAGCRFGVLFKNRLCAGPQFYGRLCFCWPSDAYRR